MKNFARRNQLLVIAALVLFILPFLYMGLVRSLKHILLEHRTFVSAVCNNGDSSITSFSNDEMTATQEETMAKKLEAHLCTQNGQDGIFLLHSRWSY